MNIVTLYTKSSLTMLAVLDAITRNGSVKVLGVDTERLYTNEEDHDVTMTSVTVETTALRGDIELVANLVNNDPVYVCDEDPADWK